MSLHSFLSSSFASAELDSGVFLDIFDVDKPDFIDGLEDTVSCQSCSPEDDAYFFESESLSFFQ